MQIAATVLDVTRKRSNSPRQRRSLESPVPGNWHAGIGKGLTEKGLEVPRRLPTSLDEGRPGEAVLNRAAYSIRLSAGGLSGRPAVTGPPNVVSLLPANARCVSRAG